MTPDQIAKPLRIMDDVQRRRLTNTLMNAPVVKRAIKDARFGTVGAQLREQFQSQIDFQNLIRPELLEQMRKQNAALLDSPGVKRMLASVDFKLLPGLTDQITAYGEQLAAEVAADAAVPGEVVGGRLEQLAQEREAIVKCLWRFAVVLEAAGHLPQSPIPPLIGFLFLMLAVLSEAADDVLSEREDE